MSATKGKALPVDVYDKDGNMMKIEFSTATGEHIIDAVWDETEEQTSENRVAFRDWAYKHLQKEGWEILK
jgi:hypothetical protein